MKTRAGRRLIHVGMATLGCAVLAFIWPTAGWFIPVVLGIAVVGVLVDYFNLRREFPLLSVRRSHPPIVGRASPLPVTLACNSLLDRLAHVTIREVSPEGAAPPYWIEEVAIGPRGQAEISREFRFATRGRYPFGPIFVRLRGRLDFLEMQTSLPVLSTVKVLPEGIASRDELTKNVRAQVEHLEKISASRRRGHGTEFESLDEFRLGDDPRRIDWRSTARMRRPVVRRYQIEQHRDVVILIDCGRLMGADVGKGSKLDCSVDAALMLSRVALLHGDRCGLGYFDEQVLGYLPPSGGTRAFHVLLDAVYDLKSRWRETDFSPMFSTLQTKQQKRSLIVVLSDIIDTETTKRFRASVASLTQRHLVVFVALRTPFLRQLITANVSNVLEGARHALAFRLLQDREKAIHSLRRAGVDVLDLEPAQVTVPLINHFIKIRERNLL
ncbi:MAG: DUF58 domain-containing protein [Planctomycetota bacterium]